MTTSRHRFPVGDRVRGRVSAVPWGPGRTGVIVDLDAPGCGFVDILDMPEEPERWPRVGKHGVFEVLQHRHGEVRLYPLDAGMRSRWHRRSGPHWAALCKQYPVGTPVTGTVTDVFVSNREYVVSFDRHRSVLEYEDPPPVLGSVGEYTVFRLLEWTQRIALEPARAHRS